MYMEISRNLTAPLEISSQTRCGVIVADACLKPLFLNQEAIRIMDLPRDAVGSSVQACLSQITKPMDLRYPSVSEFYSGRRHYFCRAFPFEPTHASGLRPAVLFLLERSQITSSDLELVAKAFRLTPREQSVLALLAVGLTTKGIAEHLDVSSNTVKAFLRTVMSKMSVSTRPELIRKFLNHSYLTRARNAADQLPPIPAAADRTGRA